MSLTGKALIRKCSSCGYHKVVIYYADGRPDTCPYCSTSVEIKDWQRPGSLVVCLSCGGIGSHINDESCLACGGSGRLEEDWHRGWEEMIDLISIEDGS